MILRFLFYFAAFCVFYCECARILCVAPTPSISHQVIFRAITQELAGRGHDVTFITTDPYENNTYSNLKEIDTHDVSYEDFVKEFVLKLKGNDLRNFTEVLFHSLNSAFEIQMQQPNVKKIFNQSRDAYDLLISEALVRTSHGIVHKFDAPLITVSTFYPTFYINSAVGIPNHFSMYPSFLRTKQNNLSLWDKLYQLYIDYISVSAVNKLEYTEHNAMVKRMFGDDCPDLTELEKSIEMFFINTNHMWEENRPVPPNVVFMGGIHVKPEKPLPKDIKALLDKSTNGIIYVSLGTNVMPSKFNVEKQKIFMNVFAKLPYTIVMKWDGYPSVDVPENVNIYNWLPQNDLLRHPNVKMFITQGGLQSTDEAIEAGVPLVALPVLGDQHLNAEKYEKFGIGVKLDFYDMSEEALMNGVQKVLRDTSYKENVQRLGRLRRDQPERPIDRAMWWMEYVIRNRGARHLKPAAALASWTEFLMLDVFLVLLAVVTLFVLLCYYSVQVCLSFVFRDGHKKID